MMFIKSFIAFWLLAVAGGVSASVAESEDWPTWRYDAKRSAASPPNQEKLQFDLSYEPVAMGKMLLVPSMVGDHVSAYDTETGALKWRFYADGPVRFAPVAERGRVYFVSDDGYLYCLNAAKGELLWKFRGGPSARRAIGNNRLISTWPARGAPVLVDGTVYFAASIWPFMGVFVHALDADTGEVIWTNSGIGSTYMVQVKEGSGFGTVAPQGYLAATREHLIVPGGRTLPAVFRRRTGELVCFQPLQRQGGYDVCVHDGWFFNRGQVCEIADSRAIGQWQGWACVGGRLIDTGPGGSLDVRGLVREEGPQDRPKLRDRWKGRVPVTLSPSSTDIPWTVWQAAASCAWIATRARYAGHTRPSSHCGTTVSLWGQTRCSAWTACPFPSPSDAGAAVYPCRTVAGSWPSTSAPERSSGADPITSSVPGCATRPTTTSSSRQAAAPSTGPETRPSEA